ncbi:MAG: prolyl oligopeptidase family serine peptidase [Legionellales bacterium]|nr:prolyl oligopeptidase family serine peptidase [Legionellales bacterium]
MNKTIRIFFTWGGLLCVGLVLILFFTYITQRTMIYFPEPLIENNPATWDAPTLQVVQYPSSDDLTINSWYQPAQAELPTIVFFHGNAGHIGGRVPKLKGLINAGYGVLLAGYRGYDGNDGNPTETGLYEDGRAAFTFLQNQGVDANQIILFGESLGTGVSVQLATEYPVRGIILQSPFTSLVAVGKLHYPYLPVTQLLQDRYDSLSKITDVRSPLLILHGKRDDIVPFSQGQELFAAAAQPKQFLEYETVMHNDFPDFTTEIVEFINSLSS